MNELGCGTGMLAVGGYLCKMLIYRGLECFLFWHGLCCGGNVYCLRRACRRTKLAVLDGVLAVPCDSQSALARLNSFWRVVVVGPLLPLMALMVGSHANGRRETGQDGNVAAISVPFVVPWNYPAGAGYVNTPCGYDSIKSARPTFLLR